MINKDTTKNRNNNLISPYDYVSIDSMKFAHFSNQKMPVISAYGKILEETTSLALTIKKD